MSDSFFALFSPEGAHNVRYETLEGANSNGLPGKSQIHSSLSSFKTYMDTLGRTTLTLEVDSLTDEARDAQLIVSYYKPFRCGFSLRSY